MHMYPAGYKRIIQETLAFIIMNQQTSIKFFRIMLIENKFSIYESE